MCCETAIPRPSVEAQDLMDEFLNCQFITKKNSDNFLNPRDSALEDEDCVQKCIEDSILQLVLIFFADFIDNPP